ncbi:MAG: hypothetical protein ACFN26_08680, partial [Kingella denitrificans]
MQRFPIWALITAAYRSKFRLKSSLHPEKSSAGCFCVVCRLIRDASAGTKSRPRANKPWEYYFYIDFEGNMSSEKVRMA